MSAVSAVRLGSLPSGWVATPPASHSKNTPEEAPVTQIREVPEDVPLPRGFEGIIGDSPALRDALKQAELVAHTDSTVLIEGETGAGKEVIADAIHNLSTRRHNSIIKVNCAAIPAGLLESELFGHERGAFTGAVAPRVGRFQLADKGTLFLDEIGDLPPELQPKLLRILQDQQFERLGSGRTVKTDVRLIAATHCDLAKLVEEGKFRGDLYYRLNVFPIMAPPLRERGEDVSLLARHFCDQYARRMNKRIDDFPPEVRRALLNYDWPGNVRELQNVIERAVIMSQGGVLRPQIPESKRGVRRSSGSPRTLEEVERQHILDVLGEANWVVGGREGAAAMLGLNRTTLTFRMQKLGIFRPTLRERL